MGLVGFMILYVNFLNILTNWQSQKKKLNFKVVIDLSIGFRLWFLFINVIIV